MWEAFSAFHIRIADSAPELLRRYVVERVVRAVFAILAPPVRQRRPPIVQRAESASVEALRAAFRGSSRRARSASVCPVGCERARPSSSPPS